MQGCMEFWIHGSIGNLSESTFWKRFFCSLVFPHLLSSGMCFARLYQFELLKKLSIKSLPLDIKFSRFALRSHTSFNLGIFKTRVAFS